MFDMNKMLTQENVYSAKGKSYIKEKTDELRKSCDNELEFNKEMNKFFEKLK